MTLLVLEHRATTSERSGAVAGNSSSGSLQYEVKGHLNRRSFDHHIDTAKVQNIPKLLKRKGHKPTNIIEIRRAYSGESGEISLFQQNNIIFFLNHLLANLQFCKFANKYNLVYEQESLRAF